MTAPSSGILVVDKTAGATSFDAVALARKRLGVRRIGHAGTLDPPATGVLPLLVGEATKLTPYLMDQDKEYVTTVRFGVTTYTHDLTCRVLSETLGSALGCGGAVERLVRTRVGPFALDVAVAWSELEDALATALWARLLPLDAGLGHLPAARLDAGGARRFVHGQAADVAAPVAAGTHARAYDPTGGPPGAGGGGTTGPRHRPARMVDAERPGPS